MSCDRITTDHSGYTCVNCGNCSWHCQCKRAYRADPHAPNERDQQDMQRSESREGEQK
jgi:hypothetical protein